MLDQVFTSDKRRGRPASKPTWGSHPPPIPTTPHQYFLYDMLAMLVN